MKRLLGRQLKKLGLSDELMPRELSQWQSFLGLVLCSYESAEEDRALLERSLTLVSREMKERWDELKSNVAIQELQRENIHTKSKMAAIGEMAGNIAHEINNPLATIKLLGQQMQELLSEENTDRAEIHDMLNRILETTNRINEIIKGMKLVARDPSNDPLECINAKQILSVTLSLCRERLKLANIPIRVVCPNEKTCFKGRQTEIIQVLLNLLNNSIDAVERQAEKWIRIDVASTESKILISVTDSGPGVPEVLQSKIFQTFFTTKEPGKGTGIGLSTSLRLAKRQGGNLQLDTKSSHTSFVLELASCSLALEVSS